MMRRLHADEQGATAIVLAICLVAFLAMLALTLDVGGLLLHRREMVNGADAAALAAAQSCASRTDTSDPEAMADGVARDNVATLTAAEVAGTNITEIVNCDAGPGHLTVGYTSQQALFFAPALGFQRTSPVSAEATATWGPAGMAGPVPVVLNVGAFQGTCDIPNIAKGTTCYLWYDNNLFGGSSFGYLDLGNGWDVSATDSCNNAGGSRQLSDWINGTTPVGTPSLHYPYHTYVCVDGGLRGNVDSSVWGEVSNLKGQTRDFPINGTSPADNASQVMKNSQIDKYNIIGFAHLEIVDVLTVSQAGGASGSCSVKVNPALSPGTYPWSVFGNSQGCPGSLIPDAVTVTQFDSLTSGDYSYSSAGFTLKKALPKNSAVAFTWSKGGTCGTAPNASARCLVVRWNGSTLGGDDPGHGADFGMEAIKLCDGRYKSCLG